REAIDRAQGGIEFFCFEVWGKARANADARTRALEDAAKLVAKVASPIKRDLIIDTLAKALGVELAVVRNAVSRTGGGQGNHAQRDVRHPNAPAAPAPTAAPVTPGGAAAAVPDAEAEVVALLADHPKLIASSEADKAFWLLTDERLQAMYREARE